MKTLEPVAELRKPINLRFPCRCMHLPMPVVPSTARAVNSVVVWVPLCSPVMVPRRPSVHSGQLNVCVCHQRLHQIFGEARVGIPDYSFEDHRSAAVPTRPRPAFAMRAGIAAKA